MRIKITFGQQDIIGSISFYFEHLYQQIGFIQEF